MIPKRPLQPEPALFACVLEPALEALPAAARHWERGRAWTVCWRSLGVPPVGFADPPAHDLWRYRVQGLDAVGGEMLLVVTAQAEGDPGWYEVRCLSATMKLHSLRRVEPDGTRADVALPAEVSWVGDRSDEDGVWRGVLEVGRRRFTAERRYRDGEPGWSETILRAGADAVLLGEIVPPWGVNPSFTPRWEKGTTWKVKNVWSAIDATNVDALLVHEEIWQFEVVDPAARRDGVECFRLEVRPAADDPDARPHPFYRLWIARPTATVVALEEEYGPGASTDFAVPAPADSFVQPERTFHQCFDLPRLPAAFAAETRDVELGGAAPTRQEITFQGPDELRVALRHPFRRDALVVREEWRRGAPWPVRIVRTMELDGAGPEQVCASELLP